MSYVDSKKREYSYGEVGSSFFKFVAILIKFTLSWHTNVESLICFVPSSWSSFLQTIFFGYRRWSHAYQGSLCLTNNYLLSSFMFWFSIEPFDFMNYPILIQPYLTWLCWLEKNHGKILKKNSDTYDVIMLFGSAIRFDSNFYQGFLNYWLTSTNVFVFHWEWRLVYVVVILGLVIGDSSFNHYILSILGNWGLFLRIVSCHASGFFQLMLKTMVQFQNSNASSSLFNSSTSSLFLLDL